MRITGINDQTIASSGRPRPAPRHTVADESTRADASTSQGRALIPLSPAKSNAQAPAPTRQPANFLAHLIATKQSLPQTRERRRIEPSIATAIYAAAHEPASGLAGRALSRAM